MLVKELAERYGLKSTKAIYDRLSALDITLPKKNRKSYATDEIVEKLDKLQEHLDNGGSLKDYDKETLVATYQEVIESDNTSQHFAGSNVTSLHFPERNNTALQVIERDDTLPNVIYIERDRDPLFANRMLKEVTKAVSIAINVF